ncbi:MULTISPECIES: SO2930 family diheme c-type cytochrome [unclassified Novosphingobium]|uniref:SO2930 family diheme c-type cytochrome n=1 Tax=unclassified Novosphingobium TaxID=2644732 RepID=UPI000F5F26D4|nr:MULTISPECIES: SO2930 family diheme c-type cytochrome [unclassified Novosphingobium]MBF5092663.1 hypothetical protein [Novosphingobium sp. NBM11]RQW45056.1 hypothetical protein EH199_05735 [Novosphingobium sp. LASN5T]
MPKSLRFVLWSLVASVLGFAMLTHHSSAAGSREDFPAKLSQWKLIQRAGDRLAAAPSGVTYELATPLFTDYALKWRVLFIPNGKKAAYNPDRAFDLPVGTVIAKTFYYPVAPADHTGESTDVVKARASDYQDGVGGLRLAHVRLMETRLLVHRAGGWVALPYVWDEDQRDATLERVGDAIPLTMVDGAERKDFVYVVPNANDCANCHAPNFTTGEINHIEPIGIKARHLNRDFPGKFGTINQLTRLQRLGYLTGAPAAASAPRNVDWHDERLPVDARARSYLDINCSHCHSPVGAARTTGLWFDQGHEHGADWASPRRIGVCKQIVAGGHGGGGLPFDVAPGEPEKSILLYRLRSNVPGTMMPEIGRSLVHAEGIALVRSWIERMEGQCRLASEQ